MSNWLICHLCNNWSTTVSSNFKLWSHEERACACAPRLVISFSVLVSLNGGSHAAFHSLSFNYVISYATISVTA